MLESLLRDGPQNGKTAESLQELKYLVLSSRVDADGDGMVGDNPRLKNHNGHANPRAESSHHTEYTSG